jgi:phage/plasmid-associated DNA primase
VTMPHKEETTICEFCRKGHVIQRLEDIAFRQWSDIGWISCRVTAATEEYLADEDIPAIWLQECCERGPQFWTSAAEFYENHKLWAERSGEFVVSAKRFSLQLRDRGFDRAKMDGQRGFRWRREA